MCHGVPKYCVKSEQTRKKAHSRPFFNASRKTEIVSVPPLRPAAPPYFASACETPERSAPSPDATYGEIRRSSFPSSPHPSSSSEMPCGTLPQTFRCDPAHIRNAQRRSAPGSRAARKRTPPSANPWELRILPLECSQNAVPERLPHRVPCALSPANPRANRRWWSLPGFSARKDSEGPAARREKDCRKLFRRYEFQAKPIFLRQSLCAQRSAQQFVPRCRESS